VLISEISVTLCHKSISVLHDINAAAVYLKHENALISPFTKNPKCGMLKFKVYFSVTQMRRQR
jgi:hypothetical protein